MPTSKTTAVFLSLFFLLFLSPIFKGSLNAQRTEQNIYHTKGKIIKWVEHPDILTGYITLSNFDYFKYEAKTKDDFDNFSKVVVGKNPVTLYFIKNDDQSIVIAVKGNGVWGIIPTQKVYPGNIAKGSVRSNN